MWLLTDLFHDLPEVGDADKPWLVFFLDEAHLLFDDASEAFLESTTRSVRLIRSKGVGVFFVAQTPKDVPADVVLAQLGKTASSTRRDPVARARVPDGAGREEGAGPESAYERPVDGRWADRGAKGPDEMRDAAPERRAEEGPSVVERVAGSGVFTSLARSVGTRIGREITRSLFGTARTARRSGRRRR